MLLSFTVENFLSFKDRSTLDMTPDSLKESPEYLHIPYLYDPKVRVLKSISIYGHNSHGKSNFLKAYQFLKDLIFITSPDISKSHITNTQPFVLNISSSQKPSFFELVFYLKKTKYRYNILLNSKQIFEESLYYSEAGVRENYIFHRIGSEFKTNKSWHKENKNIVDRIILYNQAHQVFLSGLISAKEIPTRIKEISDWISGNIILSEKTDDIYLENAVKILSDETYRPLINKLIDLGDLGFSTITCKIQKFRANDVLDTELLKTWFKRELKDFSLYSFHKIYNDSQKLIDTIHFDFQKNESAGTIRFFTLACYLSYVIKEGQLLIVDELDSKFHSDLLQVILKFYNDEKYNVSGSQMIFTTHNTAPLDDILRRDQVVFVEKNEVGESKIRKAHTSERPIRIGTSMEREYRRGNLGGISKKLRQHNSQTSFDF
jgi:AAA15 family ATPase/GTPase